MVLEEFMMSTHRFLSCTFAILLAAAVTAQAPGYHVVNTFPLCGSCSGDYLAFD